MSDYSSIVADLVAANRILAVEGIVDAFGHVSSRHPTKPNHFLLSRAKSPELVEARDIMEFTFDGAAAGPRGKSGERGYLERFIHAGVYEARPDVQCVVHTHSRSLVCFSVTEAKLRPLWHVAGTIGGDIPVWDSQRSFGDTDLLVSNAGMGRDLARTLGDAACLLMRGHGCTVIGKSIREAVYTAYYLAANAEAQLQASRLGEVKFLTAGEIEKINRQMAQSKTGQGVDRAWEYWCRRAGVKSNPNSAAVTRNHSPSSKRGRRR